MDHPEPSPALRHQAAVFTGGFTLECGAVLPELEVAYRTYGTLNADRSNAVLVCHALTGDQYVAEPHPLTGKPGWWSQSRRPRPPGRHRPVLRRSAPTSWAAAWAAPGRAARDPAAASWGTDFPTVTIRDMVHAQRLLIERLGIPRLFAAIGGSMGGMQVLEWAASFPEMVFAAVPVATAAFHSAQNIAFHEVGRQAIFADPDWEGGAYWQSGKTPARGLAVARMAAHITYLSEQALTRKFGRRVRSNCEADRNAITLFGDMFEVESYLRHQGSTFVNRFDANSYLTITRAMDLFDLAADHGGDLATAFRGLAHPVLHRLLRQRLAVPDRAIPRHRPRAQPRRRQRQLRRDQQRQGPRRLPARRAGPAPHALGLSRRLRGACRPDVEARRSNSSPRTCASTSSSCRR